MKIEVSVELGNVLYMALHLRFRFETDFKPSSQKPGHLQLSEDAP